MKAFLKGIAVLIALAVSAGCWDRVEIEERGFVVGSAVDLAEDGTYELTFQYIVPRAVQGKSTGSGQTSAKPFQNISASGETLFKAARKMSNEVSRSPYLEHNKIIIVSEQLARAGKLPEVLDLFVRDPEMRRAAKVMISVGKAKKVLDIKPNIEALPVQYINSTSENPNKSESIVPTVTIGKVHRFLLEEHSYAIPRITKVGNRVSLSGAAVFGSDNRLRGFLEGDETSGRNYFSGAILTDAIKIEMGGQLLEFEVKRATRKVRANVVDPKSPVFTVHVKVEGNIGESHASVDLLDPQIVREIEKRAAERIESNMYAVLEKLQKQYKADVIGFSECLNEDHHRVWDKIMRDWDRGENLFSQSKVIVRVGVRLRNIGAIEQVQPGEG
ncbi:Ger(x)C family spore germination protein [Cohnella hongkongensis]|uniref:Ger(X)C family spore germination protein n=1 Tax=Cohnella hongkongensis TaxID=178337 RepID=A0ABV9FBC3_9BACL